MERNSKSEKFILGAAILALGALIIKKLIKNRILYKDSLISKPSDSQKIPKPRTPHVKVIPKVYLKGGRKIIDVRKVIEVRANPLPYHLEQGWKKKGRFYQGYYRCQRRGAFRGEIEERFNGDFKFYIFDPPEAILTGSHKACFTNVGTGRYHIHFGLDGKSLDAGIMAVERILYQSLKS